MIRCPCGLEHASKDGLTVVGWQECGGGEAALLVNCTCGSTICAEYHTDAPLCGRCRQAIVGGARRRYDEQTERVYCEPCAARMSLGAAPPALAFKQWVKYGTLDALSNWRMTIATCVGSP